MTMWKNRYITKKFETKKLILRPEKLRKPQPQPLYYNYRIVGSKTTVERLQEYKARNSNATNCQLSALLTASL